MASADEMVNENYTPSDNDELVLDALKNGKDEGKPWGRANRVWISEITGLDKGSAEYSLRNLLNAGWITRPARGLYELVDDPREESQSLMSPAEKKRKMMGVAIAVLESDAFSESGKQSARQLAKSIFDVDPEDVDRERLIQLAHSNRDTAPLYRAYYEDVYDDPVPES